MYDIAIIGGGPAGATLARLIGSKYKVLLLERRTFQGPLYAGVQKCCGGLIAPDAQKMLAVFGLGIPKSVILSPQMFSVRTIDIDNALERYYQRHYINIDREEFDRWLHSLIPPQGEIIHGSVYRGHEVKAGFANIKYSKAGKKILIRTLEKAPSAPTSTFEKKAASKASQICIGRGRVGLIGEAAGFISPSSAEGLRYTLRSALALGDGLSHGIESWDGFYKNNAGPLFENIVLKNLKSPFMYNRILRACVMKTGVASIDLYSEV